MGTKKTTSKDFIIANYPEVKHSEFNAKGELDVALLKSQLVLGQKNFVLMKIEKASTVLNITKILIELQKEYDIQLAIFELYDTLNFEEIPMKVIHINDLKRNLQNLEEAIIDGQIGYVVWCHGADSHEWDDLGFQCSTEQWLECSTIFWNWVKSMDKKLGRPLPVSCALFGGYRKDDYQSVLNLHTADFVECMNILLNLEVKYTIKVQPKYSYSHGKEEYVR